MTSDTHQDFVARSRQPMWSIIVLVLAGALMIFMGIESLAPDFRLSGRGLFLNEIPTWFRGTFFFGVAVLCLGGGLLHLWRRFSPKVEVEADPQGITSHLFWGKGQLRWPDIVALERKANWLFVFGTGPDANPKKLVINAGGIDAPIDNLYAIIAQHRPDLLARA